MNSTFIYFYFTNFSTYLKLVDDSKNVKVSNHFKYTFGESIFKNSSEYITSNQAQRTQNIP